MTQRSILVAVDIEDQNTAEGKRRLNAVCLAADFFARRLKAGIDLLYVEDMKALRRDKWDPEAVRSRHLEHRANLNLLSAQFEIPVSAGIEKGPAAERILKDSRRSELIIMGTHGVKGLRRLLVGSAAEEVIRHSKRPVMVVGPVAQEKGLDFAGRSDVKMLVATDLGKNSRAAERYALSLAERIGARVVLFYCLSDSINALMVTSALSGGAVYHLDEIIAETRDDAMHILEQKCRFFRRRGVDCEYKIGAVLSHCGIYAEAENGYSLIIMGTHGRNIVLSAYFGSTARETILNASVPVITVHS